MTMPDNNATHPAAGITQPFTARTPQPFRVQFLNAPSDCGFLVQFATHDGLAIGLPVVCQSDKAADVASPGPGNYQFTVYPPSNGSVMQIDCFAPPPPHAQQWCYAAVIGTASITIVVQADVVIGPDQTASVDNPVTTAA